MKTIKFHCEYGLFESYVQGVHPIICASFVKNCLWDTPSKITVFVEESKTGNIIIAKPSENEALKWVVPHIGWKWHGGRVIKPVFTSFSLKVKPGRYNVYISEGWI